MSALTGNQIKNSYTGLLKTTDNLPVTGTPKAMEDGAGNTIPMSIATGSIDFSGNIDFSAATVTGLPSSGGGIATKDISAIAYNANGTQASPTGETYYSTCGLTIAGISGISIPNGFINYYPVQFIAGETIDEIAIWCVTGSAGSTMQIGIYNTEEDINGNVRPHQLLTILDTLDLSTSGKKVGAAIGWVVPASGVYFCAQLITGGSGVTTWGMNATNNMATALAFTGVTSSAKLGNIQQSGQTVFPDDLSTVNLQGNNSAIHTIVGFKKS